MIEINNLKKSYSGKTVLNIESLKINAGESFGLVGNNGAGKTTLFSLLLDIVEPESGEGKIKGEVIKGNTRWKKFTGAFLDEGFLIDFLTPEEYFEFVGNLENFNKRELRTKLEEYSDLFNGEILNKGKYIRQLSKGNQMKVGIVGAMLKNPELLILDEPFANIDPTTQFRLIEHLKKLNESNKVTLLISSHDLNHVTEVCGRIAILENGRIIMDKIKDEKTLLELKSYFAV